MRIGWIPRLMFLCSACIIVIGFLSMRSGLTLWTKVEQSFIEKRLFIRNWTVRTRLAVLSPEGNEFVRYGLRFEDDPSVCGVVIANHSIPSPQPVGGPKAGPVAFLNCIVPLPYIVGLFLVPPVVVAVTGHLRKRRRKQQYRCRSCAYLLHGIASDRCPECGTPIETWGSSEIKRDRENR